MLFKYILGRTGEPFVITQMTDNVSAAVEQYLGTDQACAVVVQGYRGIGKTMLAYYLEDYYSQRIPTAIVTPPGTRNQNLSLQIVDDAEKYPVRRVRNMLKNLAAGQVAVLLVASDSPDIMQAVSQVPGLAAHFFRLEGLSDGEAAILLNNQGIQEGWYETLQHLFGGHPLALAYAATTELVCSPLPPGDTSPIHQALLQEVSQALEGYLLDKAGIWTREEREMYSEMMGLITPVRILTPALFQTLTGIFTPQFQLPQTQGLMRIVPPFLRPKPDYAKMLRSLAARGLLAPTSDPSGCLQGHALPEGLRYPLFMNQLHHPSRKQLAVLQCLSEQAEAAANRDQTFSAAWKGTSMDYQQDIFLVAQALLASEEGQSY